MTLEMLAVLALIGYGVYIVWMILKIAHRPWRVRCGWRRGQR